MTVDPVNRLWIRPVTTRLCRYININPNIITLLSFAVGLASLYHLLLQQYIIAGLLFLLYELLDDLDGDMARYWDRQTREGKYLDNFIDTVILPAFPLCLGLSLNQPMTGIVCYVAYMLNDHGYFSKLRCYGLNSKKMILTDDERDAGIIGVLVSCATMGTGFQVLMLSVGVMISPMIILYVYCALMVMNCIYRVVSVMV